MRVLLVSSDEFLLTTRALLLSSVGFEAFMASDLHSALRAVHQYEPHIIVIGHTLSAGSQSSYIERLEQSAPGVHCISLNKGVAPDDLLRVCRAATRQSTLKQTYTIEPSVNPVTSVA